MVISYNFCKMEGSVIKSRVGVIEYHELGDEGRNKLQYVENFYQNRSKPPPYY